ncbi:MAG: flagellar hook-associated protein FlgL [Gammaproteobacteria bacterium]|nr:flagellar hook-associated protein FlgL [Gammaproteobacteria bacterium]
MRISSAYFSRKLATDYMQKQSELAITQSQLASGKKINRPSDDPAVAVVSGSLKQLSNQFGQFDRNSTFAESRLAMEETALGSVSNVLLRMKELALAANNDTLSTEDNRAFLAEVEQQMLELVDYANTTDANGDFLFAGNKVSSKPFVGNKTIEYVGDDETKSIQIGTGRTVASSDSGADIFLRIRNGNGDLTVDASSANTGTGQISPASVTDRAVFEQQDFRVDFVSATSFNVINETTGATVLSAQPFEPGETIEFAGIQVDITGSPEAGDSFTIKPSSNQDLFTTVNNFIEILNTEPANDTEEALRKQELSGFISDLNQAFEHINAKRSEVGTRQVYIESSREENESVKAQIDITISGFEDLDYAEAVTRMESQLTSLEALQSSFSRIESLSLFDYL